MDVVLNMIYNAERQQNENTWEYSKIIWKDRSGSLMSGLSTLKTSIPRWLANLIGFPILSGYTKIWQETVIYII